MDKKYKLLTELDMFISNYNLNNLLYEKQLKPQMGFIFLLLQ